jgi:capsular exopolysaccharide synthesis family protein
MESNSELQRFQSDLKHLMSAVKRRWCPALLGSGAIFCLAAVVTYIQGPSYLASGKLLLEKQNSTSSVTESAKELSQLGALGSNDPVSNEMEVINSVQMAQKVISALNLKDEDGAPLKAQVFTDKRMSVDKKKETDVIELTYKSKSPEEAAKVVNKIMSVYLENSVAVDRSKALERGKFISRELPNIEAQVIKAEDAIRRFKETNKISDLAAEKDSTEAGLLAIKQKLRETSTLLKGSVSRSESLRSLLGVEPKIAIEMSSVSLTPSVQDVITEFHQAESQLANARNRYQENHPIIIDLRDKVNTLRNTLQNRVKQVVDNRVSLSSKQIETKGVKQSLLDDYVKLQVENISLNTEVNSLNHEKEIYLNRVKVLPKLEQQQRELERQLTTSQSTYSMLLNKLQEIRIAANQSVANARIIEYAVPPEKALTSSIVLKLLIGLLTGGLFGIAITLFLELNDKSIKTVEELTERLGYTLLGIVPDFEFAGHSKTIHDTEIDRRYPQLIVKEFPFSPISEAYRMLHSNVRFMNTDCELKTIVVTSCIPEEGKSTVSANLALTMAQQGLNVLLIDADMRRPMQHHIWQIKQSFGLSDLLVGQVDLEKAMHVEIPGLSILTSGTLPPHPGTLLESKKMVSLLQKFSEEFDVVILDTPPLLPTNDPRILSRITDGLILVASPGVVNSDHSASAKELLKHLEHKVLGMVVNKVTPKHEPNSYFYYGEKYQLNSYKSLEKVQS